MERLSVSRRTPTLAAALLLSTNLVTADAALLAHFDFEDANGGFTLAGKDLALNFSTGLWRDADGTSKKGTGNPGFALSTTSFRDGNRLLLTLAPAPGFDLRLSNIDFELLASKSGPTAWQVSLADSQVASGSTATSFKAEHIALNSAFFNGPLELALSASGARLPAGTLRLDNFKLHGTLQPSVSAVPLPALGWMFGGAALGLARWRRRSV